MCLYPLRLKISIAAVELYHTLISFNLKPMQPVLASLNI